jgi:hypothetical protein
LAPSAIFSILIERWAIQSYICPWHSKYKIVLFKFSVFCDHFFSRNVWHNFWGWDSGTRQVMRALCSIY